MTTPVLQILLVETSFLIREGIKTLLSQLGIAFRMEEYMGSCENLPRQLQKTNPKIAIINPELISKHPINRAETTMNGIIFVALASESLLDNVNSQFDFVLNINAPKTELTKTIELILNKAGFLSHENESSALSERETDILKCVARGLTNNEISEKLFISVHTVMTHRKNITRKLGIKTVSGLTIYAILNKLIKAEELKGAIQEI